MKRIIYFFAFSLFFVSSCSENGRYVPVVIQGYSYSNGDHTFREESKVFSMDTQTGKLHRTSVEDDESGNVKDK